MTPVVMLVVVTVNLLCTAATGGAETQEATHVVCLSKSDNATFNFTLPESCESKKLVILDHADREVLQWILPCEIDVDPKYAGRVKWTCEPSPCLLRLTLLRLTEEDTGTFQCRKGAMLGPVMPQCSVRLEVIGLEDLSTVCSYWSNNRTVACQNISQEVKICRVGEESNRDLFYSSRPFSFTLINREFGNYAVTRSNESKEDKHCSEDYMFNVEKHTEDNAEEGFNQAYISVGCIFFVFFVIFIVGIDIIIKACRSFCKGERHRE